MKEENKKGGIRSTFRVGGDRVGGDRRVQGRLEEEIWGIIKELGKVCLRELREALLSRDIKVSEETVRKTLERMMLKGRVARVSTGCYARVKTLDEYFSEEKEEKIEIPVVLRKAKVAYGRQLVEQVLKEHPNIKLLDIEKAAGGLRGEYIIGGATSDESFRFLRTYSRMYTGSIIAAYARLRIGGTLPFELSFNLGNYKKPHYQFDGVRFIPDYIDKMGGSVEVLVKRIKIIEPIIKKDEKLKGLPIELFKEVTSKYSDYDSIEYRLDIYFSAVYEARRKRYSSDYIIALVDGSLFPGHLDPGIRPCNERCPSKLMAELERDYPDIVKELLERKVNIIKKYSQLYQQAEDNIVLVGAIKHSNDETLQVLVGEYYGISDQKLLSLGGLRGGEVLGPVRKHRLKEWVEEVKAMELDTKIGTREPPIETYYVMKSSDGLPACFDIIFPESLSEREKKLVLYVLYQMLEEDQRHSQFSTEPRLITHTPYPIIVLDDILTKKSREIANLMSAEMEQALTELLRKLAELAAKYPATTMLYLYNPVTNSSWRLV